MLRCFAMTLLLFGLLAPAALAGGVAGRISLAVEGADLARLGPVVAYLEPLDGPAARGALSRATVRQHAVRFNPEFLVVAVGQPVAMPNDDKIFHNVFSKSRPNDFDLGTYPAGQSKTVSFSHPGLVRIYCSIHEGMSGGIYVAPSRYFDTASAKGYYRIADVPAGRYRLVVWNERLPETRREVEIPDQGEKRLDFALAAPTP
jgi:plastocyanin